MGVSMGWACGWHPVHTRDRSLPRCPGGMNMGWVEGAGAGAGAGSTWESWVRRPTQGRRAVG